MDKSSLTLGSLFDGSGGFPLAGLLCGITPVWAAEIEPFPIRVTTKRLPGVKHLGDVRQIHGANIPPVDIITFGSPCQSFSVAGKREGLEGKSGLFYDAARIVREMYVATNGEYPKFAVMENVAGIFSSKTNGKSDFLEVLNELIHIKQGGLVPDESLSIPEPKDGWSTAGEIVGDGVSLGWRTFDAQFWGVPQRRRRCYIVLHLAGECAGRVLFDESRLRGHPAPRGFPWQGTAGDSAAGAGGAVCVLNDQGGSVMEVSENITGTLRAQDRRHPPVVAQSAGFCTEHSAQSHGVGYEDEKSPTLRAGTVGAVVYDARGNGDGETVNCITGDHNGHISNYTALAVTPKTFDIRQTSDGTVITRNHAYETDTSRALDTGQGLPGSNHGGIAVVEPKLYGIDSLGSNSMKSANPNSGIYEMDVSRTLDTGACTGNGGQVVVSIEGNGSRPSHKGTGVSDDGVSFSLNTVEQHGVAYAMTTGSYAEVYEEQAPTLQARDYKDAPIVNQPHYIVRRLTPTECALLQGFPADWCDGLATQRPTKEEIAFWTKVWETHRRIMGKSDTPKSRSQIIKWLRDPHSDAAEYTMWGNGVSLPVVVFVLGGIAALFR